MKIKITETVEVDPEKWANEFGIDEADVREDVKAYFYSWMQHQIDHLGLNQREIK